MSLTKLSHSSLSPKKKTQMPAEIPGTDSPKPKTKTPKTKTAKPKTTKTKAKASGEKKHRALAVVKEVRRISRASLARIFAAGNNSPRAGEPVQDRMTAEIDELMYEAVSDSVHMTEAAGQRTIQLEHFERSQAMAA
jgi:hypothetical protein